MKTRAAQALFQTFFQALRKDESPSRHTWGGRLRINGKDHLDVAVYKVDGCCWATLTTWSDEDVPCVAFVPLAQLTAWWQKIARELGDALRGEEEVQ